jgi:hypothetical protein
MSKLAPFYGGLHCAVLIGRPRARRVAIKIAARRAQCCPTSSMRPLSKAFPFHTGQSRKFMHILQLCGGWLGRGATGAQDTASQPLGPARVFLESGFQLDAFTLQCFTCVTLICISVNSSPRRSHSGSPGVWDQEFASVLNSAKREVFCEHLSGRTGRATASLDGAYRNGFSQT